MDPLQWMADKQLILKELIKQHNTLNDSSLSINILWMKKLCVYNKSTIKMVFNSNHCFWLQYKSSIHYTTFFCEKVILRREICTDQALFTSENSPKQFQTNMWVDF